MDNAYSYRRVGHRQGEGRGDGLVKCSDISKDTPKLMQCTHLIIVTTNDVHVSCNGPQIVVRFTVANIASAKDLLDLSRNKKFLKLGGQVVGSMRDMKVADDEDEDHVGVWLG